MKMYSKERISVSSVIDVKNNGYLLMFYFIIAFPDSIYFLEEVDGELHLFDVISKTKVDLDNVLNSIISVDTKSIIFHYIPEHENIESKLIQDKGDMLFSRPNIPFGTKQPLFPLTSHS